MAATSLHALAGAAGIAVDWTDSAEQTHQLSDATLIRLLQALELPCRDAEQRRQSLERLQAEASAWPALLTADVGQTLSLSGVWQGVTHGSLRDERGALHPLRIEPQGQFVAPTTPGYYELEVGQRRLTLAVAPTRCYSIGEACSDADPHRWGPVAQVYSLARTGDGGLGDSRAACELAHHAARSGADALGLSPLHAMAPATTSSYSPYSPSHRGFLNWLHADPSQILGHDAWQQALQRSGCDEAWRQAQDARTIDWPAQAQMRRKIWQALFEDFALAPSALQQELQRFEQQGGAALRAHALIAARQQWAASRNESVSWHDWESGWAERGTSAPGFFAAAHATDLAFEVFAQWIAASCWQQAQQAARDAGMGLGLIVDLAVGFQDGGSEAWRHRNLLLRGLSLGAPPDAFNASGQQWGITSYAPRALRETGYQPFIDLLRANMSLGGGIRIDHILGLARLWVVPRDAPASEGGYLAYPLDDLLRLITLESWRHNCIVIGEDLGTLPDTLRQTLAARGILGTDVLVFNRDTQGDFLPPAQWRTSAVATTTTHDLPPLAAWRQGLDIGWRARIQHWDEASRTAAVHERERDVQRLDRVLAELPGEPLPVAAASLDWAAMRFVAHSAAPLVLLPLEDALGLQQQPNLPGTVDEHPNWRHRLPLLEHMDALDAAMDWMSRQRAEVDRHD